MADKKKYPAILLIGPSGSGKTPLGDILQKKGSGGLAEACCCHFDFGAQLRQVAEAKTKPACLTAKEVAAVRRSLQSGVLLTDEQFPIAEKILRGFIADCPISQRDVIVLNGLPRHIGQAKAMATIVEIRLLVYLKCSLETARARIESNVGGDRTWRIDDAPERVAKRIQSFSQHTTRLLEYYQRLHTPIISLPVENGTTPLGMRQMLSRQLIRLALNLTTAKAS